MSSTLIPSEAAKPMPRLRRDLGFGDAGTDITGERGVVIHDPLRHRFFRMPSRFQHLLEVLRAGDTPSLAPQDNEKFNELLEFLGGQRLLESQRGQAESLTKEREATTHSPVMSLLHNYISFRIPLLRPEAFLDKTLAWVLPLAGRTTFMVLFFLGVIGLYFAARQWDQFAAAFMSSFSVAGATSYALTLFVLKIFHELGHAYVARAYGCRVPSIGVAFMVLTPMLYTDASDAWRLSSRWQRLAIGAAGMLVEIGIAAVALFFWAFLPDGPARSVCFFVAVTAWLTSVFINLSPFMRFDGYHMMVDALGMHSLAARSFALATWRLREGLFKPDDPPPEFFPQGLRRFLIGFAMLTWLYRLSLFFGIAYLLYVSLPKAVGIPLALVEIYFFILMPIIRELKVWKNMGLKNLLSTGRSKISALVFGGLAVLAALPLDRHVHVPTVVLPALEAKIFAPEPAQVLQVLHQAGDVVEKGDVLAQLVVPDMAHLQRNAQLRHDIAEVRLQRVAADQKDRDQFLISERERQTAVAELEGLRARGDLLQLRAPIAGRITGDTVALHPGQWVGGEDLLFQIVDESGSRMVGLVLEREASRIALGASIRFVSSSGDDAARGGVVQDIGVPGGEGIALSYLSSQFGGPLAVQPGQAGGSKPINGHLPLLIESSDPALATAQTGTAVVEAAPQSFLGFLAGRVATVFMRESGF